MKSLLLGADDYVGRWVSYRVGAPMHAGDKTIGLLDPAQGLIAGVLYQDFNGANIVAHIAAEPGANWLNRQFLWTIFDYPFNQLGVKRITGQVAAKNLPARQFDEHLGFVAEATLKDALPDDDLIIYCMRRENCRWLALKGPGYGQEILCAEDT